MTWRNGNGNGAGDVQAAWTRVKRRLRAELGEDVFASWFARLELEDVVNGVARLTVFFLLLFAGFTALLIRRAGQRWETR